MSKIDQLFSALKEEFMERDEVITGLLLGLLTGNNVLLIGPPGTAKSMLANSLAEKVKNIRYFTYLMTKFTRPDEVIGPISLKGLEKDEFIRVLKGRLADVHVAFLDEVFNSNSACLNAILNIMNEKQVLNGTRVREVPLITLVGAANELPVEISGELKAFYDRFLLRYQVDYLQNPKELENIITSKPGKKDLKSVSIDDLIQWQNELDKVRIPQQVLSGFISLVLELRKRGVMISDRRTKQSYQLLKAKAYISRRDTVGLEDLRVLKDTLWILPSDKELFSEVIAEIQKPVRERVAEISEEATSLLKELDNNNKFGVGTETGAKLIGLKDELINLLNQNQSNVDLAADINFTINEIDDFINHAVQKMIKAGGGITCHDH